MQPGGFFYNILPFMEQQALHDLGMGQAATSSLQLDSLEQAFQTPVAAFDCPSHRPLTTFPYHQQTANNMMTPTVAARSDYAANGGDTQPSACYAGPSSYAQADPTLPQVLAKRASGVGPFGPTDAMRMDGISFLLARSRWRISPTGQATLCWPARSISTRIIILTARTSAMIKAGTSDSTGISPAKEERRVPCIDTRRARTFTRLVRQRRSSGAGFVFCDGSVRTIGYLIDLATFGYLCSRADGNPINGSKF